MNDWVDVNKELPESRTLVYIYVIYTKNPYDDVTERISIGTYQEGYWHDWFDFPFADDYNVTHWMPLEWPEKPEGA
jgi:hypothetical protein